MRVSFWLAAVFMAFIGLASPCSAQATRTWVSGVGDDANPCSITAPCKTFAGAISKTASSGEINVLTAGGFGALTITKPITIRADHLESGIVVPGTFGIVVNAGTGDKVVLEGLDFEGTGTGTDGIRVAQVGVLTVIRCSIRGFQNGVSVVSSSAGNTARVFIEDSQILNNTIGVNLAPTAGNAGAFIERSLIDKNTTAATQLNASSTILANYSTFTGSPAAISYAGGGTFDSTGTNLFIGTGAPNASVMLK